MNTIIKLLTVLIAGTPLCCHSVAQTKLPDPWGITGQGAGYLSSLVAMRDEEELYRSSEQWDDFAQAIGTVTSFLGNYQEAKDYFESVSFASRWTTPPEEGCHAVNALKTLETLATSEQAIFINEAHHVPEHRAFSINVLKALRSLGFEYFAAETLNSNLYSPGYPILGTTGYYTDEPVYGDLIRTALALGYKVIAYESASESSQNEREENQAKNLVRRIVDKDPSAKMIVHAGYGHIAERGAEGWKPMAVYFKELTGINPVTIDQTTTANVSTLNESSFFWCSDGLWVANDHEGNYDLMLFHPEVSYELGRPTWLQFNGERQLYTLEKTICNENYPCLIQARVFEEGATAVPLDQIEVRDELSSTTLLLAVSRLIETNNRSE
jgi:hypothetical protein